MRTGTTMIELAGSPRTIGALWGKINAKHIHYDMEKYYLSPAREAGIVQSELFARNRKFIELCRNLAPHWLEEGEAIAREAGIDEELYMAFAGGVYRSLFLGNECVSYSISADETENGRIFFHKTRDNVKKAQSAFILKSSVRGVNKFIAVSDASVVSCMMMLNDKGLAGSADCGGLPVEKPRFRGMMNTHLLRYIAEKAASCEEALEIVSEFIKKRWYAGAAKVGTHWHFVDSSGKRLEISCNSDEMTHEYHTEKAYFSYKADMKCAKILKNAQSPVDFAFFRNVSRDASMCVDLPGYGTSIAGMSVEISREYPGVLSRAWISFPANGLGFPLFIGGEKTPLPLVNGKVWSVFKKFGFNGSDRNSKRWAEIEKFDFINQLILEKNIGEICAAGKPGNAAAILDEWAGAAASAHLASASQ